MNEGKIERWIWVSSSKERVHFVIDNKAKTWLYEWMSTKSPKEGDEIIDSQGEVYRILDQYGLYSYDWRDDILFAFLDSWFGRFLTKIVRRPKAYHYIKRYEGVIDEEYNLV